MPNKLLVRSNGRAMVADIAAMHGNIRRFIGWELHPEAPAPTPGLARMHDPPGQNPVWVAHNEPVSVDDDPHYRGNIQRGELLAADEATARLCGVEFHLSANEGNK